MSNKIGLPTVINYVAKEVSDDEYTSKMKCDSNVISKDIEVRKMIQGLLDSNLEMLETILNKQSLTIQEFNLKIGVKIEDINE